MAIGQLDNWKLAYQVSPIYLTGPPVASVPEGKLPFLALVQPNLFPVSAGAIGGEQTLANYNLASLMPSNIDLDDAFGAFNVLPGGSLIQQVVAKYPFANQTYAANAIIRNPITVSLIWDTPMRGAKAWNTKLTTMIALKQRLDAHNNAGGTYIIVTPGYVYDNCVMTGLTDASRGSSQLPQNAWRFDFERPLIVMAELQAAQNSLIAKISGGLPTNGDWSGPATGIGSTTAIPNMSAGPNATIPSMTATGVPSGTPSGPTATIGPAYNPGASNPYALGGSSYNA